MSAQQKMHWIILGWVGLFFGFAITLPIAMHRVSATGKFVGQPVKSLTCAGKSLKNRVVIPFATCVAMKVIPKKTN
jgi:hypothetical protein